jgi:hypothetical protein
MLIMTIPRQLTIATAASRTALASLLLLALLAIASSSTARADAPAAHYTYRSSNCAYASVADPLNVRFFNIDWLGVQAGMAQYMAPWGAMLEHPNGSSSQYAYRNGTCVASAYSSGRQWGPMVYAPLGLRKYKYHARYFTTGTGQVSTDAHIERKRRTGTCGTTSIGWNDAVYRRYNGMSGFDAAMEKIASAYRTQSSSTVSVVQSPSPFTHLFKQCTGEIVDWSGRVAYITRPPGP